MDRRGPIVVPLDGSKNAEAAVAPASQLARAYAVPLVFVHVAEAEARANDLAAATRHFTGYAEELLKRDGDPALSWSAQVRAGDAADEILEASKDAGAICIATHGRGGFHAAFIGSVADKVVRQQGVLPVLTVPVDRDTDLRAGPIVVGLDGSERAERALPVARDLAARLKVGITLLRAYDLPPAPAQEFFVYEYNSIDILAAAAATYLQHVAQEGEDTRTALMGPATAIRQVTDQVDAGMVVLTAHGRGLRGRLVLGSVTDRVIHSVRRPVLVIPDG